MHTPKKSHYKVALHVVRYVKSQPVLNLLMSRKEMRRLRPFVILIRLHVQCPKKYISDFYIKLGTSLISLRSKKQSIISRSFVEAEYKCMTQTVVELTWLKGLQQELHVDVQLPMELYGDNKTIL